MPHAILFEHANFHGEHKHVFGPEDNLSALDDNFFNNKVSSIVVIEGNWAFFSNAGFQNQYPHILGPGLYDWVETFGIKNDDLSSLQPSSGPAALCGRTFEGQVVLFEHAHFHGAHKHIFDAEPNLNAADDSFFNDKTSSVVVPSRIGIDSGWQNVGPIDISGCIFQVSVDPNNHQRIYAAAANGGLWRRDLQAATTWVPLTDNNGSLIIQAVAVAPSTGRLYIADGLGQIVLSDDDGRTWTPTSGTNLGGFRQISKLLVDPLDPRTLFVGSLTGFWKSIDSGRNWSLLEGPEIMDAAMDPGDASIIYIGKRNVGLMKWDNGQGRFNMILPWSRATNPASTSIRIGLGGQGTDANRTVAVKFAQEVFVDQSGGRGPFVSKGLIGEAGQLDWDNVIAVDPFDNDVILAGGESLFRTSDGGKTWTGPVAGFNTANFPHEDQQSIAFDRVQRGVVFLSNDGGVFRSEDGGVTWVDLNDGLVTIQFEHAGISGIGRHRALGNANHQGPIGSNDLTTRRWLERGGHSWEHANVYSDPKRPDLYYLFGGWLARQRFPGRNSANDFLNDFGQFQPTAIAIDTRTTSNTLVAGAADGSIRIMRTLDGDQDHPIWSLEVANNIGASPIISIVFAPCKPGKAYAVSEAGEVFRKSDINTSDPWDRTGTAPIGGVKNLAINPFIEDRLYIITEKAVALSPDGGKTWNSISGTGQGALPNLRLSWILSHPSDGHTLFVGAIDGGVFMTRDEGQFWFSFNEGLPRAELYQVLWHESYLYAPTYGRGLWRRPVGP